jgi:hypothetical protein
MRTPFHDIFERPSKEGSRKNWMTLGFVAASLIPSMVLIVNRVFPSVPDELTFVAGVGIAVVLSNVTHLLLTARQAKKKTMREDLK